ncbi:MAG: hypothetical protein JJ896_11990 [Rhodothermales bacterium]|nr:hypothetical protein [Rhodothermales bacterium]MBO6780364.1 hypothetical protein [Rhodothermales bacterium]
MAWVVGYVVNPMVLPAAFFGWLTWALSWPVEDAWKAVGIAVLFLGVAPLTLVLWLVVSGEARTLEVRDRKKRLPAFAVSVLFGIGAVWAASAGEWPTTNLLPALFAVFPINSTLLLLINLRTKISVHVASVAATAAMGLWMVFGADLPAAYPVAAALFTPVLMWARVRDDAHSRNQVMLGAAFGFIVPALELWLFTRVGWLVLS